MADQAVEGMSEMVNWNVNLTQRNSLQIEVQFQTTLPQWKCGRHVHLGGSECIQPLLLLTA